MKGRREKDHLPIAQIKTLRLKVATEHTDQGNENQDLNLL